RLVLPEPLRVVVGRVDQVLGVAAHEGQARVVEDLGDHRRAGAVHAGHGDGAGDRLSPHGADPTCAPEPRIPPRGRGTPVAPGRRTAGRSAGDGGRSPGRV